MYFAVRRHMISIADASAYSYSAPVTTLSPLVLVEGKPSATDVLQVCFCTGNHPHY